MLDLPGLDGNHGCFCGTMSKGGQDFGALILYYIRPSGELPGKEYL